jgi:hypothetical protein
MAAPDFHSLHDARTGLTLGMERITERTATFWRRRLALDAHIFCDKYTFQCKERVGAAGAMHGRPLVPGEDDLGPIRSIQEFTHLGPESFEGYTPRVAPRFLDLFELHMKFASDSPPLAKLRDYISAWKGFLWNLDRPSDATWVAYLTTQPVTGLLCDLPDGDVTTSIKMAMTVQITDGIYCPLGIYACPTGVFADRAKGVRRGPLAMLLQAGVARLVDEVNPGKVDLAVFRPIASMRTILERSGIPFRLSKGFVPSDDPFHGEAIVDDAASHPDLASLGIKNQGLLLVDPQVRRIYTLDRSHWFVQSPYLGHSNHDRDLMAKYPYLMIRRQDLARDLHAGMNRTGHEKPEGKGEDKAPTAHPRS